MRPMFNELSPPARKLSTFVPLSDAKFALLMRLYRRRKVIVAGRHLAPGWRDSSWQPSSALPGQQKPTPRRSPRPGDVRLR